MNTGSYVKCGCQHCSGHIEFDRTQLTPENCVISCPHCGAATLLSVASEAKATNHLKSTLRNLGISDSDFLNVLDESKANHAIESARQIKEFLFELGRDGYLRDRTPAEILNKLMCLDSSAFPTPSSLLAHIRVNFPNLLLSESYGKSKARQEQERQEFMHEGRFSPLITVTEIPGRQPGEPDSTPAQKRFLRDLGVRDEQTLTRLGKIAASELIDRLRDIR